VKDFNDPRIHFLEQSGKGVSNARNEAVSFSKNEYVAFLDADDEWMPRHLETILRLIKKYPESGMFTDAYKIYTKDGKIFWAMYKCIPDAPWDGLLPDYFRSGALGHVPVLTSSGVIPKKIFHEMGGFPEGYWYAEDADLFGKIALKYPVAFSWEFGVLYHTEALNRACDKEYPRNNEEPFVKFARVALTKGDIRQDLIDSVNEYITRREIYRAIWNLHDGNFKTVEIILKQCKTKLQNNKKMKLLILAKSKLLIQETVPSPVSLFIWKIKRNLIEIVRKK
jgi:glycosyltransferase involved in cell wall biosynthesis